MGLKDMLINGGSPLSYGNGATPTPNPGATQQSKLHADGNVASYSVNGANASTVNAAYVAYNDGYNNSLPQPSQLDLNGITPSKYLDNPPQ
jgi:hypothetical protein